MAVPGACYIEGIDKQSHREEPPNDYEVNVYVVVDKFYLVEKDEIKQTLTAHIKMKMFWEDHRIKTNFSDDEKIDNDYDILNLRIHRSLLRVKEIRDRIKIWIPDYDFDNQLMVTPVDGHASVSESVKINREALGKNSSVIEGH